MHDLRLAIRSLRSTPIVTAAAVISLTLGIGANTAIFSLFDSLVLKSLPIPDPGRLVRLSGVNAPEEGGPYSYAFYDEVRRHGDLFTGTAAYNCCGAATLTVGERSQTLTRMWVSGDFFSTLGVAAAVGRVIQPDDDRFGGGRDGIVAVITDRLWRERFDARSDTVGLPVTIDRAPVRIVGVLPRDFLGLEVGRTIDIALPGHAEPTVMPAIPFSENVAFLAILGRLRPDRTLAATIEALGAAQPAIRQTTQPRNLPPSEWLKAPLTLVPAGRGTSTLRGQFERPLVVLLAVAGLVLLIACANLANLLLARGIARRSELAVRVALGASRWQVLRPLLLESVVLAAIGTTAGVLFARWAAVAMTTMLSTAAAHIVLDFSIDWRLVSFAAATMATTVVLFGMWPALRAAKVDPLSGLQSRGRGASADHRTGLSSGLLVAQVAISLVLVVAAALFVETFARLARAPLGFDRDHVMVATIAAPTTPARERNAFYHRLVKAASAVSGVAAAGGSINPPLLGEFTGDFVASAPGAPPPADAEPISQYDTVTPGWFTAEGIPIHDGRDFDEHDTLTSQRIMVVNEAFVRRFLGGRANVVGTQLELSYRLQFGGYLSYGTRTIVGVVGDAVYRSIRDISKPTMYWALSQFDGPIMWSNFFVSVRSQSPSPLGLSRELIAAFTALNPDLRITFRPVSDQVDEALRQDRLVAWLSGFVGALALLLAAIGLYGTTSYVVTRQRPEIGVRLALGAQPSDVVRLVFSRVAMLVCAGIGLGAVVSVWASQLVAALVYGLGPRDPATLAAAIITLSTAAATAVAIPARRVARVDPSDILRNP